jgi:glyoxylase-like metal-dependent hydrolase (beta-lactamase superfamily II)
MTYTIQALVNGHCQVTEEITYQGGRRDVLVPFTLYIWWLQGAERPILVDTGPRDVEAFNRATAAYIIGGITQAPDEKTPALLAKWGIDPAEVGHVLLSHLHGDHFSYVGLFPNAQVVVSRRGLPDGYPQETEDLPSELVPVHQQGRLVAAADDQEILPGLRVFWLGCHSPCSQGIAVETAKGTAVLAGDVAYMYRHVEENAIINTGDEPPCYAALERIRREADIVLPGHDPEIMRRWPGGRIS